MAKRKKKASLGNLAFDISSIFIGVLSLAFIALPLLSYQYTITPIIGDPKTELITYNLTELLNQEAMAEAVNFTSFEDMTAGNGVIGILLCIVIGLAGLAIIFGLISAIFNKSKALNTISIINGLMLFIALVVMAVFMFGLLSNFDFEKINIDIKLLKVTEDYRMSWAAAGYTLTALISLSNIFALIIKRARHA